MYSAYVRRGNIVHLGADVVCDGFNDAPYGVRVQTHVHDDHMQEWSNSMYSDIYMTPATKELILAENFRSSEHFRNNLIPKRSDGSYSRSDGMQGEFALFNSGHMLGSCMVSVKHDRKRYLYTSDFSWPLPNADKELLKKSYHDVLVIDASYGHPEKSIRRYTQENVTQELISIVSREIQNHTIRIVAHRGRLQRAYQILASELETSAIEIYGSEHVNKTIEIYHKYLGMAGTSYKGLEKPSGKKSGNKIILVDTRDQKVLEMPNPTDIIIRLNETRSKDCLSVKTEHGYQICMTDHADFWGTIDMINLINPNAGVLTNGTYAYELATYIKEEMGREACCAVMPTNRLAG